MNKYIIIVIALLNLNLCGSEAWKSLILPGWGQSSIGNKGRANFHMLSELVLISSVIFTNSQYESYRNDYRVYGSDNAGVNWTGKTDLYASHVGNFNSMEYFNSQQLLNFGPNAFIYTSDFYFWDWENDSIMRNKYDSWRNKSETYNEAKGFLIAGMLLNRIISFFNVVSSERENSLDSNFNYSQFGNMNFIISYKF